MTSRVLITSHGTHRGAYTGVDWALFLVVGSIWGASFLFQAIGLEAFRPGLITWLRVLFGAAAIWVFPAARRATIAPEDRTAVLVVALTWVVIPLTLFPIAQGSVNSAVAGMLNGAAPIWTAVIATIMLRQPPGPRQLIGIPIGFLGVSAIALAAASEGSNQLIGVALIVIATMCYGTAFNVATPLQQRYGSVPLMARVLLIGAVLTTPFGVVSIPGSSFAWDSLAAVMAVGLLGTGVAFVLFGTLAGRVGSTRASIVGYLIPVVALVLGVVFRGDEVVPVELFGVALVIVGAYLASRREISPAAA